MGFSVETSNCTLFFRVDLTLLFTLTLEMKISMEMSRVTSVHKCYEWRKSWAVFCVLHSDLTFESWYFSLKYLQRRNFLGGFHYHNKEQSWSAGQWSTVKENYKQVEADQFSGVQGKHTAKKTLWKQCGNYTFSFVEGNLFEEKDTYWLFILLIHRSQKH